MQEFGAFDAKTHFSSLLEQVEKGAQIVITKHGKPVAKLIPVGRPSVEETSDVIARLKEFSKKNSLNGLDWKKLRDEGKK